tara:strand:+ start:113 stop:892 length:780 start_codon:yes stop_codon:yes gene_type:complete
MALEDEIINIEDLDIAKEIKIGDNILLETTDGTKLIDFKDFIIGTDNITFYDKISGGDFLQTADISALSANVDTNTTILSGISGVNDDIASLQGQVNAALDGLAAFRASINELSNVELSVSTTASVGVNAGGGGGASGTIYFTKLHFSGTDLATSGSANGTVNIGTASESFSYIANGSYQILLVLNLTYKNTDYGRAVNVLKNGSIISSREVEHTGARAPAAKGLVIMQAIRVIAGDKITLSHNLGKESIKSGDIAITV